jgi:hypothetical protein
MSRINHVYSSISSESLDLAYTDQLLTVKVKSNMGLKRKEGQFITFLCTATLSLEQTTCQKIRIALHLKQTPFSFSRFDTRKNQHSLQQNNQKPLSDFSCINTLRHMLVNIISS